MHIKKLLIIFGAVSLIFTACTSNVEESAEATASDSPTVAVTATVTPEPTATATPEPTATLTPEPFVETADDGRPWYIRVDTYNQLVSIYALDENGEYTRLINQFMCSAGARDNYTKKLFQILDDDSRYRWKFFSTFGGGYCEYVTRIYMPFLFHSVMFETKNEETLMIDTYTELSFPDSHGCIRLMPQDAKWIYENCIAGTYVEVVDGEANPELTQSYMAPPLIDGDTVPVHEQFVGEITVPAVEPNWDNFPSDGGWVYDPDTYE